MFLHPTLRRSSAWPRLAPCLLAIVAALPVGWIAAQVAGALRDIAYRDEIDTALALLVRIDSGGGFLDFLRHFFSGDEHRRITSRLIFAGGYWLDGSVDFRWLTVIGNSFLLVACALLIAAVEGEVRRLRLAAVLALVVFQLENYESFFWSGSSIDHFQIVALAVGAVVALARRSRWSLGVAAICGLLATATLTHGFAVWPMGALMLLRDRRWRALGAWCGVALAAVAGLLWGAGPHQAFFAAALTSSRVVAAVQHGCTLLGAPLALGQLKLAPWFGAGFVVAAAVWSWRGDWPRHRVTLPLVWFVLGAAALIAVGQAGSAPEIQSRHLVLGGLAWALLVFAAIERGSSERQPFGLVLCCLPVLAAFNLAANQAYRERAETFVEHRDRAALRFRQNLADGRGPVALHALPPRATAVLTEAARRGLYRIPRLCVRRDFPLATASTRIAYAVDELNVTQQAVYLAGWAAIPDHAARRGELHVVLRSATDFLIYTTVPVRRSDVGHAAHEPRWRMAGFRFVARRSRIPPGDYQIGFLIGHQAGAEYILTPHQLKLEGAGDPALLGQ
ncbi:MAG: hypothetical protein HZA93_15785 [Verrucomicrobia bacterium]|nr:hypothetical protein [Verrucomicrobiota bacterium]